MTSARGGFGKAKVLKAMRIVFNIILLWFLRRTISTGRRRRTSILPLRSTCPTAIACDCGSALPLQVMYNSDRNIRIVDGRRPSYAVDHVLDAAGSRRTKKDREQIIQARRGG